MNNLQVCVAGAFNLDNHLPNVLRKSTTNAPMEDNRDASLCMLSVIETTQSIRFEDATFRGYSGPLRTLNGELVLIVPLRGPNVPRTNPVLNGILQGPPLNASALMVLKPDTLLLQWERAYKEKHPYCLPFQEFEVNL